VGVVTDHEVLGVVAQGGDPSQVTVQDIMCPCPAFVSENDDVLDTLCWMHRHHLRDVIVHGKGGALLGTVSLNQLADSVASELSEVASASPEEYAQDRIALH
jgi:predicted transcriptional regulator